MGTHQKLKVGDRVVFIHKDLPAAPTPALEAHRISQGHLPSEIAVVCKVHKDDTIDLQRFADRPERQRGIYGGPATGPVHERVPLGNDPTTSNTFRVLQ